MTIDNGDGIVVSNNNYNDGIETDTTLTQDVSVIHSNVDTITTSQSQDVSISTNNEEVLAAEYYIHPSRPAVIRHTVVFEVDAEVATVASTNSEDSNNVANRQVGYNAYAIDQVSGQSLPVARAVGGENDGIRERVRLEISWKGVILFVLTFGALCFIALLIKLSKR